MSEFGVRLTGDNSEYRSMLDDSQKRGENFATKLADKVGDKLYGLRDLSHALATALGINIENISQQVARFVDGMSKETEDSFKRITDDSEAATRALLAQIEKRRTTEQQITQVQKEMNSLQTAQATTAEKIAATQAESKKTWLDILASSGSLGALLAKHYISNKANEEATRLTADNMGRAKVLQEDAAKTDDLQAKLANEKADAKKREADEAAKLEADENRRADETERRREQIEENKKKAAADEVDRSTELARLLLKSSEDLTEQDKVRIKVLTGETTQLKINAEIVDLTAKLQNGSINPAERERLSILVGQLQVIKQQVQSATELVSVIRNVYGSADKDLTDRQLQEKAGNLKKQLTAAQLANDSGAFFYQQKLAEVNFELGRRDSFRADYAQKGEKAFLDFSAFDEQTLRSYLTNNPADQQRQQADQAVIDINQRLANSGLFPKKTGPGG